MKRFQSPCREMMFQSTSSLIRERNKNPKRKRSIQFRFNPLPL
ncbi:hypothetical protein LEP1GSC074_2399 [Leptospira noguchii str. Hook]|nr:hypothetical protein LEP1GSC074_2399 [Leptospira noguchii str. Hook]